jgi:ABC-type uncharacterized transport system substrate-binding protein
MASQPHRPIQQGESSQDLPFERLTRFPFVINLNTAKALGLTVCRRRSFCVPTR